MQKIVFSFLFLFISAVLHAQEDYAQEAKQSVETKHRIYIDFLGSIPGGDFASTDGSKEKSGFAEKGSNTNIGYHYNLTDDNYLTLSLRSFSYAVDLNEFAKELGLDNSSVNYQIDSDGYGVGGLTIGYKYLVGKKDIKFYANPFIGFAGLVVGELKVSAVGSGGSIEVTQEQNEPNSAFLYGINGGVEYRLSKLINFNFQLGLAAADFEIEAEVETRDVNGIVTVEPISYDQPYSAFNAGISIGFNF